jgi:hypothetical protein
MRRSTPILIVLLGASVLGNILLIARGSRAPEPEATTACRLPGASPDPANVATLKESLDAERKKNEELRARIERLETDKKVLVQEPAPGAGKTDKLAAFKDKLRKLMKTLKDPAAKAGAIDPDNMVEFTETMMEFFKMAAVRAKDPKTYSEYLQAFYEAALEGDANALTPAQSSALSKLFEDFGNALSKVPPTPSGERLLKELEIEAGVMARVQEVLTGAQRELLSKNEMNMMASGNMLSTSYITKEGGAEQIAKMWTQLYQLEPSQEPQAKLAAQAYMDAMNRAGGKSYIFDGSGSAEAYEYRLRSVREQLAALNMLSASMTPAQQDRLRTQTVREFLIFDGKSGVEVTVPAEK